MPKSEYFQTLERIFGKDFKIMCEFYEENGENWGLLFSKIKSNYNDPFSEETNPDFAVRRLVLIPLSRESNQKKHNISVFKICIKNSDIKSDSNTPWDYSFLGEKDEVNDENLVIPNSSKIDNLDNKNIGEWRVKEGINYWVSKTEDYINLPALTIDLPEPIIGGWKYQELSSNLGKFQHINNIPKIEIGITKEYYFDDIVNRDWNSNYNSFEYYPFLNLANFEEKSKDKPGNVIPRAINISNYKTTFKWFEKRWSKGGRIISQSRLENFVFVKNDEDIFNLTSSNWPTLENEFKKTNNSYYNDPNIRQYSGLFPNRDRLNTFLNQESKVNSLIFQTELQQLIPIYIYSYRWTKEELGEIIGHTKLGIEDEDIPIIHVIQKCLPDSDNILIHVGKVKNQNLFHYIWNERIKILLDSLGNISSARPVALFPEIDLFNNGSFTYVQEWKVSRNSGVKSLIDYKFIKDNEDEGEKSLLKIKQFPYQRDIECSSESKAKFKFKIDNLEIKNDGNIPKNQSVASVFQFTPKGKGGEVTAKNFGNLVDGSVKIEFGDEYKTEESIGYFALKLQWVATQRPFYLWEWGHEQSSGDRLIPAFYIQNFLLPVNSIQAAGQDRLPGENILSPSSLEGESEGAGGRTEPPLLINLKSKDKSSEKFPELFLSVSESINIGQDHRLTLKLIKLNNDYGKDSSSRMKAVIIDSNPQFIGLVESSLLQSSGFDDGAWVLAIRDADSGWKFLDDKASKEGFNLVLPSQAIGEAYVKNGNEGEPKVGAAIDFRFGAPTILRLAPERLDKRYVNAPWNLRRIWGVPGEVSPGLPLLEAQFELLYGLQGHLKPENTLLAELSSKLGEVPVPPINTIVWKPTSIQNEEFNKRWKGYLEFFRVWKSRLAILEPSKESEFQSTSFDKNLSFRPRVTENPESPENPIGAQLRLPVKTDDMSGDVVKYHSKDGLAGGFHYGFESAAIYEEFWRESDRSSSAELEAPAFSSMGGWGKQVARFAQDKTVIKSTTTMGRTHFYSVERIGRIGVFWHKAKHVIEYERTVVPSEQFAGSQPGHLGRTLVRKVREFIEILEPERRYPDFDNSELDAPGSVLGCHFQSKIIPVLSSWGRDIKGTRTDDSFGLIGWEVPLWMPGAQPSVYPKPQIQFELTPPPDSDEKSIWVNLSEPQNLFFFTDTRSKLGDIDITASNVQQWPRVKYVDFSPLPEPVPYDVSPAYSDDPDHIDRELPAAIDIPPGFERFTFRIDAHGLPAAVASRYYPDSAISGTLRTVSMQRGKKIVPKEERKPTDEEVVLQELLGKDSLLQNFTNGFEEINKKIIRANGKFQEFSEFKDDITNKLKDVKTKIGKLQKEPKVDLTNEEFSEIWKKTQELLDEEKRLQTIPSKYLWKETLESADGMVNRIMDFYDRESGKIYLELQANLSDRKEIFNRFLGRVEEFDLGLELSLDAAHTTLSEGVDFPFNQLLKSLEDLDSLVIGGLEKIEDTVDLKEKLKIINERYSSIYNSIHLKLYAEKTGLIEKWTAKEGPLKAYANKINLAFKGVPTPDIVHTKLGEIQDDFTRIEEIINELKASFETAIEHFEKEIFDVKKNLKTSLDHYFGILRELNSSINKLKLDLLKELKEKWDSFGPDLILEKFKKFFLETSQTDENLRGKLRKRLITGDENKGSTEKVEGFSGLQKILFNGTNDSVFLAIKFLDDVLEGFERIVKNSLIEFFGNSANSIDDWLETLDSYNRLEALLVGSAGDLDAILNESRKLADNVNQEFGRLAGEVGEKIKELDRVVDSAEELQAAGAQTLRNFRSVWDEFTAPGIGFNRKTIALLVRTKPEDIEERLSLTPVLGKVNQINDQLAGLGIRLPSVAITDRLIPAKNVWNDFKESQLKKFDLSNIFSDVGGMSFDRLFPGLKIPEAARDAINVTQGFDKQKLMAWVNAEANFPMPPSSRLMDFGPVLVTLDNAKLSGFSRLEADESGVNKSNYGELLATWNINVGGMPLMIFRDTKIIFENGKTTIDLDPERMEMPGILDLIYKATQNIPIPPDPDSDSGPFKVGMHKVKGIPAGIIAAINTPPVSVGGGPTGMSNLSFGAHFLLAFLDDNLDFKFRTSFGFNIGTKESPFNLTLFFLGGGGYISYKTVFVPERRVSDGLEVFFALSIHASAGLTFSLGPIRGNIHLYFGIEGSYVKPMGGSGQTHFTVFLMVNGTINVMNIVTVRLVLLLQLTYNSSNGELIGVGRIKLTVRKSPFCKIKINRPYRKVLSKKKGSRKKITLEDRADRILKTLN